MRKGGTMRLLAFAMVILLAGISIGAIGARELCIRGHCGDETQERALTPATGTTAIYSAGASVKATATFVLEPTPTVCAKPSGDDDTETAPSSTTPGKLPRSNDCRDCPPDEITGLAILGDSVADEYQADSPRGGEYVETTFNWVELVARERDINLGAWGSRTEPRRSGYEFNWARSGATSASLIADGQHTGVAEQIKDGQVSHVIIQIGINDFYWEDVAIHIYSGDLADEELEQFLDDLVHNIQLAVQEVKFVGKDQLIVSSVLNFPSVGLIPELETFFPDDDGRQRILDALSEVNVKLKAMTEQEGVHFFDYNAALEVELADRIHPDDPLTIMVGGERIDLGTKGNDPLHVFVDDDWAHPGTVFSGLMANLFIAEMNEVFGTEIEPFSDDEILRIAGVS